MSGTPLPGKALLAAGIRPVHPGPFFARRFLEPRGIDIPAAAAALEMNVSELESFIGEHQRIDIGFAGKLALFTGASETFWLNMQAAVDLSKTWEVVE